jgi:hypothetical protein
MKRDDAMFVRKDAVFSDDGMYRYRLVRVWDETKPMLGWCALNPSTADMVELDPTTWRMVEFSMKFGYGGFDLANMYAYKSTDPEGLWKAKDPVGPDNDKAIARIALSTEGMVVCWGGNARRDRVYTVTKLLQAVEKPLWCLRLTKGSSKKLPQPEHPLYLPGSSERIAWP